MKFALVVPALNEQDAIASTLRRVLAARSKVIESTDVVEMTVVFVNDGSTDQTQQIVDEQEFDEVVKVRFEHNRGYGAAIKAGWQATDAELVGFIDGDGTCDPDFCVQLVNRLTETNADVVLAARLNPQSKMPLIRKIGNKLFAALLGLVSGNDLTDTASGFRVVRRSSLRWLSPLPDGLHFTPAMSCICLLDPGLRIEEVPMPYEERIGRSKLSVVKDGCRFLFTILLAACCYAPLKTMLGAAALVALTFGLLAWMILATVKGGSATIAITAGAVAAVLIVFLACSSGLILHQLNFLLMSPRRSIGQVERLLQRLLDFKGLIIGGLVAATLGTVSLIGLAFLNLSDGMLPVIIPAIAGLWVVCGGAAALGGMIVRVIWAVGERQKALLQDSYPVRSPEDLHQSQSQEPTLGETLGNLTPTGDGQSGDRPAPDGHVVVGTCP